MASEHKSRIRRWTVVIVLLLTVFGCGIADLFLAKIRRSAERMKCNNHLKQIGLAAHNFNDSFGHLPAGTSGDMSRPPDERRSFFVDLLPFIESDDGRLQKAPGWREVAELVPVDWSWPMLRCPDWGQTDLGRVPSVSPYFGLAGLGPDAATLDLKDNRVGLWGYTRTAKLTDVTDGLSNTLMFAESTRGNDIWYRGGPSTVRGVDQTDEPYFGVDRPFAGTHRTESRLIWWKGDEPFGMNVGIADGSVRFLKHDFDPRVFDAHVTIHGGEACDGW